MHIYSIVSTFNTIIMAALGLFVLLKNPKGSIQRWWFLFMLCSAGWSFGTIWSNNTTNAIQSLFWYRTLNYFAVFIPFLFWKFVNILIDEQEKNKVVSYFIFWASILVFVLSLVFPELFVVGVKPAVFFYFIPRPGIIYHIYSICFLICVVYVHVVLFRSYRKAGSLKKNQIKYLLIAMLVGFSGGGSTFLITYGYEFPYGNFYMSLFAIIMSYAIVSHHLMDIDVFIKRTLIFTGLLMFVFGAFGAAAFFVQAVLSKFFGTNSLWTYGISLFFIVLGYDPIRNLLVNLTDKYLFQKKYDYQKILKDATKGMSKIESLEHLLGLVIHFVTMKMRVKNCAVMMRRRDYEFELGAQRGYEKNFLEYRLDDTNPMIAYLLREKEALDMEHIKEYIEEGNKKRVKGEAPHEYDFHAIQLTMEELKVACVVPSFLGHELKSMLLIGEKKSGDFFTTEDLSLLFTLAQESAIAIENAKLFDEAVNKSNQLAKINEQLEYSRNLLMKALRETEVANKQLQDTQAQLIHEQKMATLGRLAASVGHEVNNPLTILSMNVSRAILKYRKNPDLKVGDVLDLFQKMEQNIGRIKAVVNTLTGLLKKSEKGKFEPLSLKLVLEETLPLVQFQTYLDNLSGTEVEFDIPGSTPLIRGDLERLQEVFLNLFINAYHAMQGRRNRRIRVTAETDTENPALVAVNFTDNGSGMTEEIMKKIFNYGFTTKPPGRGSGMGLYMCKYIIELHGGDIRVKSKLGEGTTFTICLPSYEEGGESTAGMRIEASS